MGQARNTSMIEESTNGRDRVLHEGKRTALDIIFITSLDIMRVVHCKKVCNLYRIIIHNLNLYWRNDVTMESTSSKLDRTIKRIK